MSYQIGYKIFRKRKDGTYGPLFINKRLKMVPGIEYPAENHPTKGFAQRPGFHICRNVEGAPHIKQDGKIGVDRVWCKVKFKLQAEVHRPESQGGLWFLGSTIEILEEV